jgi:hypothetical protein
MNQIIYNASGYGINRISIEDTKNKIMLKPEANCIEFFSVSTADLYNLWDYRVFNFVCVVYNMVIAPERCKNKSFVLSDVTTMWMSYGCIYFNTKVLNFNRSIKFKIERSNKDKLLYLLMKYYNKYSISDLINGLDKVVYDACIRN